MVQAYDDEGVVRGALVSCAILDARTIQQLPGLLDLHDGIVRGTHAESPIRQRSDLLVTSRVPSLVLCAVAFHQNPSFQA
jgi:hypothetical protein